MKLDDLLKAVESHFGTFHCTKIHDEAETKDVEYRHEYDPPASLARDLPIQKLADFYQTFANLVLYRDPLSDDAAFYIASPDEWDTLDSEFRPWLDGLDEVEELLPNWIDECLVIGEIPRSGNYLLMLLSGVKRGFVYEFEHDGLEFIECAPDIEQFVYQALDPSASALTAMASHMRFVEDGDYATQWWITEMCDNRGNVVRTNG